MQSGVGLVKWAVETTPSRSRELAEGFGEMLSCHSNTSEDLLKCLRELTADDVIKASVKYQVCYYALLSARRFVGLVFIVNN